MKRADRIPRGWPWHDTIRSIIGPCPACGGEDENCKACDGDGLDRPVTAPPRMTSFRASVLDKVKSSGATRSSPLRLHGAGLAAGRWLVESGLLEVAARGFYPLHSP